MKDTEIEHLIEDEKSRQESVINLIASENYVSEEVLEALGSVFTNKYSEGYPGTRYYTGTENMDRLEDLTKLRALKLFGLMEEEWNVNVQALSGSPANLAVYNALVPLGEKILALDLNSGGHLSHGYPVTMTGKLWKQIPYKADKETGFIDYDDVEHLAKKHEPAMIVVGSSAYPRHFDYRRFRSIADDVGAHLHIDVSHEAGLIAGGVYPNPFEFADTVMMTTHKTLRGPRGALIFSRISDKLLGEKIDKSVFPGIQGGPHMNTIAGIAVALNEATTPEFKEYSEQVLKNAQVLASTLKELGWKLVTYGTENHLMLVDVFGTIGMGGRDASNLLEEHGIITNKNMIPDDSRSPSDPSGIRLGTPAETTRGMKEKEFIEIAKKIDSILRAK